MTPARGRWAASLGLASALLMLPGWNSRLAALDAPGITATSPSPPAVGNLPLNGDFATPAVGQALPGPAQWDAPDGKGVQWLEAPDGSGKAIRMNTALSERAMVAQWHAVGITSWDIPTPADSPIGESYGLSLYSAPIAIEPGRSYRVSYEFLGNAGGVKVWVRGYGEVAGERRRLWEAVVNGASGPGGAGWQPVSMDISPTAHRPGVHEVKIMLYAYYPSGVYWFRRIRLTVLPARAKTGG